MSAGSACACVKCRMGMHSGTFKRHWTGTGLGTFPGPLKQLLCSSVRPAAQQRDLCQSLLSVGHRAAPLGSEMDKLLSLSPA